MDSDYEAFWSYTHEDDDRLNGYVTRLSERISNEYAVSSGYDLQVFLDRKSLEWGDTWRAKITGALGSAPFFIAIITPKFVKSVECRKELLTFSAESKSRGYAKLLLPILLINVPDLREDSDDEVLALLARTQYVDWTKYRLMREDSAEVLTAVNNLALRIMNLQQEAQEDVQNAEQMEEQDEQTTVDQVFEKIDALLPGWSDAVDFDPVARARWNATWKERSKRAGRVLEQRRGISGAYISVWAKLGLDLAPASEERLKESKAYHKLTIELDPYVTAAFRLIEREPRFRPLLEELREGISEAMNAINGAEPGWSYDNEPVQYSAKLKQAVDNLHASEHFVSEANEIVTEWNKRITQLDTQ